MCLDKLLFFSVAFFLFCVLKELVLNDLKWEVGALLDLLFRNVSNVLSARYQNRKLVRNYILFSPLGENEAWRGLRPTQLGKEKIKQRRK